MELGASTLVAASLADGSPASTLAVKDSSATGGDLWNWDGRNAQGQAVSSGVYTMVLTRSIAGQSTQVEVKSFTVIKAPVTSTVGGLVVPAQDPVGAGQPVSLRFEAAPGCLATAELFDVAGERVAQASADGASGWLSFGAHPLAGGSYLALFRLQQGGLWRRQVIIKIAVIH
jgi:hypothetical protein